MLNYTKNVLYILYFSFGFSWEHSQKRYTMAYKIDPSACVNCGTCEPDCPVGAISENDGHREIDSSKCVSCGTCASECPATAISEE